MSIIPTPFTLPNGTVLSNRLAKSAMSENLGTRSYAPSRTLINAYKVWAEGEAGLLVTGNVMIDSKALGEPNNVVVEDRRHMALLKEWADTVKGTQTHLWPQLNHPGRQAMEQINNELVGPSAVPLKLGGRRGVTSRLPRALREEEIWEIIERFGNAAEIMKEAGFTGVQIHGAHGYLVSQFLSPKANVREDQWGGGIENRAKFAVEVYRNIRKKVGADYPIGIKMNSADFQKGGFTEEESMEVVKILSAEGMDLIEISGGTYEAPAMMKGNRESTSKREAYFLDYVEKVRNLTDTPLMLTGGFRNVAAMEEALESGALDIIGIARPFAVYPHLPKDIFTNKQSAFPTQIRKTGLRMLDLGMSIIWYAEQIRRMGNGKAPKPGLSPWGVGARYGWKILRKKLRGKGS
jgi:2,4-dienoyl-CoA reductase-like NADH-dependent reductase (Old Yellow Enzyme family)